MCHFQLHNYVLPSGEPCLDSLKKVWNFPKQVDITKSLRLFQAVKFARFIVFLFPVLPCYFFLPCISNSDSCLDLSEVVKSESPTDAVSVYPAFELRTGLVFFSVLPLPCVKLWDFRSKASWNIYENVMSGCCTPHCHICVTVTHSGPSPEEVYVGS